MNATCVPGSPSAPRLLGTYTPQPVNRGDLVFCSYRQTLCRVIGRTSDPLPWPVVIHADSSGGRNLLVELSLERTSRSETPGAHTLARGQPADDLPVAETVRWEGHSAKWGKVGGHPICAPHPPSILSRHPTSQPSLTQRQTLPQQVKQRDLARPQASRRNSSPFRNPRVHNPGVGESLTARIQNRASSHPIVRSSSLNK